MLSFRLLKEGANKVIICASHGSFDENSMKFIDLSPISQIIVTDSIPLPEKVSTRKIVQLSLAPLLATVISSDFKYRSTSEFNPEEDQFVPE
jgi:ribose-phosphate pyrophosphokinase